jgi:hypothetical protein
MGPIVLVHSNGPAAAGGGGLRDHQQRRDTAVLPQRADRSEERHRGAAAASGEEVEFRSVVLSCRRPVKRPIVYHETETKRQIQNTPPYSDRDILASA